ncbi:MAG: (Fe-S)-binding protein [Flavisolibacter sp.]|nr:(Fe-S)-binding protein [Flavisolibacter sp.]MBD0295764.1 (Fe-S)-binding protein [Flavisolibacter sp.]MBD0351118.1 (Fe-S)-binding protein [Flavisolibacter sp.]MBD0368109.1 (Fe-S)-binding protein [Flavisolibacter sp.]MBD0376627.1 (Fe-S)-binding protein [Flavisolibacter sp.]
MTVQLFVPCFVDQLFPHTVFNMIKVLEKAGCGIIYNPEHTCCGQPAFNAGFWNEARPVCSKFLNDFNLKQPIVAPSASCTGFVRNYYNKLFQDTKTVQKAKAIGMQIAELSDFLVNTLHITDFNAVLEGKATYHDSCAALRECNIKNEPRRLLANVKGLELTEMEDVETCCGFGGTFAVKFEPISVAMAEQKVEHALATGAQYLISTDLSCLMHLQGYIDNKDYSLKTMHIADVLASGW